MGLQAPQHSTGWSVQFLLFLSPIQTRGFRENLRNILSLCLAGWAEEDPAVKERRDRTSQQRGPSMITLQFSFYECRPIYQCQLQTNTGSSALWTKSLFLVCQY